MTTKLLTLGLAACFLAAAYAPDAPARPHSPASAWKWESWPDPLTKKKVVSATRISQNGMSLGFPYEGLQRMSLVLRRNADDTVDVMFVIEKGQIECDEDDCSLQIAFDNDEPVFVQGSKPADDSSDVIFLSSESALAKRIATAHEMRIAFDVFQEGRHVAIFNVAGFDPKKLGLDAPAPGEDAAGAAPAGAVQTP